MNWRLALSLSQLRTEVDGAFPNRSRESDGTIGDAAHAARTSDHDPWIIDRPGANVVSAIDFTHDPQHFDSYAFAEWIRQKRDLRVKYVISNHRIFSSVVVPWAWRPYHGANPHDHHVHISVLPEKRLYDDTTQWGVSSAGLAQYSTVPANPSPTTVPPSLHEGSVGNDVTRLQFLLSHLGLTLSTDGVFGGETKSAVQTYQEHTGLVADGVVGSRTWKAILNKEQA